MSQLETFTARVNGISLCCYSRGKGAPVILLHGFPETHHSWDLQLEALVNAGYRAITVDLRGYGESDKPERGYDLPTLAADVEQLIDTLGEGPVRIVGHDWGAAITWQLLDSAPHKVLNATIINGPHPLLMARALERNRQQLRRSWYMFFFQLPLLPELWLRRDNGKNLMRLFRHGSPGAANTPPELIDAERRSLLQAGGLSGPLAYYRRAFRENLPRLVGVGRGARPTPVDLPLTIIWGEADSCLGVELLDGVERFARDLVVHRVAGAGHFAHQERPELVNEHLLFALSRRPRKGETA